MLAQPTREKLGRGFGKKKREKKPGEWAEMVENSQEEIPGSRRSMHGFILTYSRL